MKWSDGDFPANRDAIRRAHAGHAARHGRNGVTLTPETARAVESGWLDWSDVAAAAHDVERQRVARLVPIRPQTMRRLPRPRTVGDLAVEAVLVMLGMLAIGLHRVNGGLR